MPVIENTYYIFEDHPLLIEGLKKVLPTIMPEWKSIGHASSFEEAVSNLRNAQPQFVLIDHFVSDRTGVDLVAELKATIPAQNFILISQIESKKVLNEYIEHGVLGFVSKKDDPREIRAAIEHLSKDADLYFSPSFKNLYQQNDDIEILTPREIAVIQLIAQGKTNRDVGRELSCSEFTVKTHKANIMRKLNIGNSVELSVWALRNNLVE